MALITTKELLDQYLRTKENIQFDKVYSQVARPELFKYEEEIGKQLVEMNAEELFGLFDKLSDIKHRTIQQIVSFYRGAINYYSFNYEPVVNCLNMDEFRGINLIKRITANRRKFTKDDIDYAISKIREVYSDSIPKQNYLECIIWLFYEGFANSTEIVDIKEEDISFKDRTIKVSGKTITLSERAMYLLKYVHDMESIDTYRRTIDMVDWRGRYFKYPVLSKNLGSFQLKDKQIVASIINRKITVDINKECETNLDYVNLYYLGVYQKFIKKCGSEELAKEMVYNDKVEYSRFISDFIAEEGLPAYMKATELKAYFRELV